MGKSSGGTRSGGGIVGFRESEKAIQLEVRYYGEIAPYGGFVSSQVRDVSGTMKIWVPKTQIERGALSEWIANQKRVEVKQYILNKRFNAQVIRLNTSFSDAKGKQVPVKPTKKEAEFKKKAAQKRDQALAKVRDEREKLIAKAKANGYKAHSRMRTATLQRMAAGTYKKK